MKLRFSLSLLGTLSLLLLSACQTGTASTPDHRIKVVPSPTGRGMVALPPECGDWSHQFGDPWQNDPWPTYGCAHARNLAASIENPEDLIAPREMSPADAVATAYAVDRYRTGKTEPLIDPKNEAPVAVVTPTTAGGPK